MRKVVSSLAAIGVALALTANPAEAGPGFRAGITDDVDTLFGGAHWRVPFSRSGKGTFVIQPGVDFGLGLDDNLNFMIRGTAHFGYMFPVSPDVILYPLVGPSLILYNFDTNDGSDNDTEVGVDLGIGAQFRQFALELWFGISDDIPDLTLAVSFNLNL